MSGMRRRGPLEDELIEQQALAMALHQQHKAQLRFERSLSHRDPATAPPRRSYSGKPSSGKLEYTRSASTRPRHSNDLLIDPQQLLNGTRVYTSSSSSPLLLLLWLSREMVRLFSRLSAPTSSSSSCTWPWKHMSRMIFFFSHPSAPASSSSSCAGPWKDMSRIMISFFSHPSASTNSSSCAWALKQAHEQNDCFFLLPPSAPSSSSSCALALEASTWAECQWFLSSSYYHTKLLLMCGKEDQGILGAHEQLKRTKIAEHQLKNFFCTCMLPIPFLILTSKSVSFTKAASWYQP